MIHDNDRSQPPYPDGGADGDSDESRQDVALGIWGDDIFRMEERVPAKQMVDPVSRFKDRLRRGASQRNGRPRDEDAE